jgi:glycosyltransferase involved in cell wall biosynthesis
MACLLKIPDAKSKGVISFTTPEEIQIRASTTLLQKVQQLKESYVTCLHYNWHVFDAKPDSLFDVHFCGKDDIRVTNGKDILLYEYDACNFTKRNFYPIEGKQGLEQKHWDILFVGRAVFFKGIPEFLDSIRKIYDEGLKPRVLFICPMPPKGESKRHVLYDVWDRYDRMFSAEEKDLFNLLVIRERYPFFFDRETLAHFYKSSKIFVHSAPDERRCRVAAYAWCCGLPVVGMDNIAAIIPPELRTENAFFKTNSMDDLATKIKKALNVVKNSERAFDPEPYLDHLSEVRMTNKMIGQFNKDFGVETDASFWFVNELDIRLGRHHVIASFDSPNNLKYSLTELLNDLNSKNIINELQSNKNGDPERYLEKFHPRKSPNFLKKFFHSLTK